MALITDREMPEADPLIEAAFIKFNGTSGGTLDDPPELDGTRTYIVKATCVAHHRDRRKDGEERLTVAMKIDAIYEKGKMPIVDEAQPMLFDEAMKLEADEAAADEDSDDEPELDEDADSAPSVFSHQGA